MVSPAVDWSPVLPCPPLPINGGLLSLGAAAGSGQRDYLS